MIVLKKNYYEILQILKEATEEEIKNAYKRLARMYHPDNNPGNKEAEIKFKEISEAYAVLSNPEKRKQYDGGTYNSTIQSTVTTNDAYEIFNALFQDDIKRYNNQREDYIQFLDEMEPEFNKYNLSLKE